MAQKLGELIDKISIHALREEGDLPQTYTEYMNMIFLSTPSARRATYRMTDKTGPLAISIHALREEGDTGRHPVQRRNRHFYPRSPRGGRPACLLYRSL